MHGSWYRHGRVSVHPGDQLTCREMFESEFAGKAATQDAKCKFAGRRKFKNRMQDSTRRIESGRRCAAETHTFDIREGGEGGCVGDLPGSMHPDIREGGEDGWIGGSRDNACANLAWAKFATGRVGKGGSQGTARQPIS